MIFIGTNDFNAGLPVGEWFTEEIVSVNADGEIVERVRRTPVFDDSTFRGRINKVLDNLKRTFPHKQIVLLTPIHRAFAKFGERNVQPDESYQNSCGEYIDAYIASIKEASSIWSVPVIDTYALSGLYPMHQEQKAVLIDSEFTEELRAMEVRSRQVYFRPTEEVRLTTFVSAFVEICAK